jgi:hypothetical protein
LAERFIWLWGKVQHGVGKSPDRCERKPKRRTTVKALAKVVKHRLINFIRVLERI